MKDFDLSGKVAIVTGATGLIGSHHCRALADAGATVIACDINQEKLDTLIKELGDAHRFFACDITSEEELIACRDFVLSAFGRIGGSYSPKAKYEISLETGAGWGKQWAQGQTRDSFVWRISLNIAYKF